MLSAPWSAIAEFVRVATITGIPREVNLVRPAGALGAAAHPVWEHVVASKKCLYALLKVDAQGLFLLADAVRSPSAQTIVAKVML